MEMTDEEKALQALMLDDDWPSCLGEWLSGFNMLDVLKVGRTEIRHSNILAWLLDPRESHGFGSAFLYRFVKKVCQNCCDGDNNVFLLFDCSQAVVSREWGNEKRRLDILITYKDCKQRPLVIAVENKIDAKDGKGQLDAYYDDVRAAFPADGGSRHLFVYLTPNGDDPEHVKKCNEFWIRLSYADIASILDEVLALVIRHIDIYTNI